jgi:hypothetical protein
MWQGLGRPMSWFGSELLPLGLYGPVALLGMLVPQLAIAAAASPLDRPTLEHASFTAGTVLSAGLMAAATKFEVKSGFMLALLTASGLAGMAVSEGLGMLRKRARGEVHLVRTVLGRDSCLQRNS